MQKPFLGSHQVKTPLCWKHHFTEPPLHRVTPTAMWRQLLSGEVIYLLCSQTSQDTLGNPTPPVPHHCPSEKQPGLCFCVPEDPLLPHTLTLPQPKDSKCNTGSSYTFRFCCLFSLLYITILGVILIPSDTAFHQLQTHQGAGKDIKASEERGSLSWRSSKCGDGLAHAPSFHMDRSFRLQKSPLACFSPH